MDDKIKIKPNYKQIDKINWKLNVYFSQDFTKEDGLNLSKEEYNDINELILKYITIEKVHIDSLIYLCLQFSKEVDFALNQWNDRYNAIESKIKQAETYLKLIELKEILEKTKDSKESVQLNKVIFKYEKEGISKEIEIEMPDIFMKSAEFNYKNVLGDKEFYQSTIFFLTTYIHQYDASYYRKNAAKSLKLYCKINNILEKSNVKNPAKQMKFIYSLLRHFKIIDKEMFVEKKEAEGVTSLIETPFKLKEHGRRSKLKTIKLPDLPDDYDII